MPRHPYAHAVDEAIKTITDAERAHWTPIRHRHGAQGRLHDRLSYRYLWHVIERAVRT